MAIKTLFDSSIPVDIMVSLHDELSELGLISDGCVSLETAFDSDSPIACTRYTVNRFSYSEEGHILCDCTVTVTVQHYVLGCLDYEEIDYAETFYLSELLNAVFH